MTPPPTHISPPQDAASKQVFDEVVQSYEARMADMAQLTHRLREEEALRIMEFAEIAHEIKKPLTILQNIVFQTGEGEEAQREIARAARLLDRLMAFAQLHYRAEHSATEVVDASRLVERAVSIIGALFPVTRFVIDIAPDVRVAGTEAALLHILENALENAGHHGGGVVYVTLTQTQLVIADTGAGFPEEILSGMEHFHTSSESGHGLGLMIMRRSALSCGWGIALTNSPGSGARVVVTFQVNN